MLKLVQARLQQYVNCELPDVQASFRKDRGGTSLVVQWVRYPAPNAGDLGSIPGQVTKSHMPQQRPGDSQINKCLKKKKFDKAFL